MESIFLLDLARGGDCLGGVFADTRRCLGGGYADVSFCLGGVFTDVSLVLTGVLGADAAGFLLAGVLGAAAAFVCDLVLAMITKFISHLLCILIFQ